MAPKRGSHGPKGIPRTPGQLALSPTVLGVPMGTGAAPQRFSAPHSHREQAPGTGTAPCEHPFYGHPTIKAAFWNWLEVCGALNVTTPQLGPPGTRGRWHRGPSAARCVPVPPALPLPH